ncbi:P-loop containing nucleoside triphosphate hydrolase protein [Atractiella rhizophila]|nr:P-loop containing nucleoside triphosphate hydrolase protein [Atractiella rhizophila]
MSRQYPNIIITGTPGTGKSTHATKLAEMHSQMKHLNVGEIVKTESLHSGYDEEWDTYDIDEDKLLDHLCPILEEETGGYIVDWHTNGIFPERLIDLVVVLSCDHTALWERLERRGYELKKIQENNEAEIMRVCEDEARECYKEEIVVVLQSESVEQVDENVGRILEWIKMWRIDRGFGDDEVEE